MKYLSLLLFAAAVLVTTGCGGDKDAQFRPPKGKEPKAPIQNVDRSGSPDSFLPTADGGGPTDDMDDFGN